MEQIVVQPCFDQAPQVRFLAVSRHSSREPGIYPSHDDWWLHAYTYSARLMIAGKTMELQPGSVTLIPPGTLTQYEFPDIAIHTCAHFRLSKTGVKHSLPMLTHLGAAFPAFHADFTAAVGYWPVSPERAQARLWDLLWRLVGPQKPESPDLLAQAQERIEQGLTGTICVADLAKELQCSHNTLTRVFRSRLNTTVVAYILKRRTELARHLLCEAKMPPRAVAAMIGAKDLQTFNKLLRRGSGFSPRGIREKT